MKSNLFTETIRAVLALLAASFYALFNPTISNDVQKSAAGMVGSLTTFWFAGRAR